MIELFIHRSYEYLETGKSFVKYSKLISSANLLQDDTSDMHNTGLLHRRFRYEALKAQKYNYNRERTVNNDHILTRLITTLLPSLDLDITLYMYQVEAQIDSITKYFRFTNNSSVGIVHRDIFYKNDYVVFSIVDTDIDILTIEKNWKLSTPIRVIYNDDHDLDYYIFDKSKELPSNLVVVEVDIVLLMLCYYYWYKERVFYNEPTETNLFVYKVLLNNMRLTNYDIAIFNRLINLFYKKPLNMVNIKFPIIITNFSSRIDKFLLEELKQVSKISVNAEELLIKLYAMLYKNVYDLLYIRRPIYTRQSEWVIWLARLKYMVFIIDLLGERGRYNSRKYLNSLPSKIKMLRNRNTPIYEVLPEVLLNRVTACLEYIDHMVGRR